jgi:hypothetical protein
LSKINCSRFLWQIVEVAIYDGTRISGELVHMDCSKHGCIGNLILRTSARASIIRGDSVQSIALEDIRDKVQYVEAFGKHILMLPARLYEPFQKIAEREDLTVDALVNGVLDVMVNKVKKFGFMEAMQVG